MGKNKSMRVGLVIALVVFIIVISAFLMLGQKNEKPVQSKGVSSSPPTSDMHVIPPSGLEPVSSSHVSDNSLLPGKSAKTDTHFADFEELDLESMEIRPITWKKPVYSGATKLLKEEQEEVASLVEHYDVNFQKIKNLAFHEKETALPVGNSQWTQENVIQEGGRFRTTSTSIDITACRDPLHFTMKGTNDSGNQVDLTVSFFGEQGTNTQGESWRAFYMDGFGPKFSKSYLLENGTSVHHNVKIDIDLPEIGNIAKEYKLGNDLFTVVETSVTDWWESLGSNHPDIAAKETVWFNNKTGMPQVVIREIVDEKKKSTMENPYTEVQVIEYVESEGVYYPTTIDWIGKGYQLRRKTERTQMRLNGNSLR